MNSYILAHDLGTSGNKATIYDTEGQLKGSCVYEYPTYYPFDGAVEQNPDDWWIAVCESTKQLLSESGISPTDIECVSFSGIMMGCLLVGKDGKPLRNMLIWADTRSSKQEKFMLDRVSMNRGYEITGHRLSASYTASKLLWIKDNEPELYKAGYKVLHAKDYIVYRFTGKFVTDFSDASGTNLLDLRKKEWSKELYESWDISPSILPELHASTDVIGKITDDAAKQTGLLQGTPVILGGGDGSCACVGAGVVSVGKAYNIIGTSSWISMASKEPYFDKEMRTFNWAHLDSSLYTPCGTMQAAGYSYSWYRDNLCEPEIQAAKHAGTSAYKLLDRHLNISPPGANGLLYLPYILGERSPHWNHNARGAFIGIGISSAKSDFTRAVLEGVGFNLRIIMDILENYTNIDEITMIGGGAKGIGWLQLLSDIWQKKLSVPMYIEEATSLGAAVCGGVGAGIFKDFSVIQKFNPIQNQIIPNQNNADLYNHLFKSFKHAYQQLIPVYEDLAQLKKH